MNNQKITFPLRNIGQLLKHCRRRSYKARGIIIHLGDYSSSLFYILSGSVAVIGEDSDGKEITLAYLNPGDFFGEMGLFEKKCRSARIRAKTKCEVGEISYSNFFALSAKHPEFIFAVARQISMRLAHTSRKACDLAFLDVSGRVATTLIDLCHEPDAQKKPNGIHISITRQELAKLAGCSREMAGKVLKNLAARKLVSLYGKTIVIPNGNQQKLSFINESHNFPN
ncbi:MAG: cyclic nucleotide-binding domain-containing protein [Porticoccaceae bacterium]